MDAVRMRVDRFVPDTSDIEVDTKVVRYDLALIALDTNDPVASGITKLYEDYPGFFKIYILNR